MHDANNGESVLLPQPGGGGVSRRVPFGFPHRIVEENWKRGRSTTTAPQGSCRLIQLPYHLHIWGTFFLCQKATRVRISSCLNRH